MLEILLYSHLENHVAKPLRIPDPMQSRVGALWLLLSLAGFHNSILRDILSRNIGKEHHWGMAFVQGRQYLVLAGADTVQELHQTGKPCRPDY
jgi:hypothetical protein